MHRLHEANNQDRAFVVEMARLACTLEGRLLREPDAPEVQRWRPERDLELPCLPGTPHGAERNVVSRTLDDDRRAV